MKRLYNVMNNKLFIICCAKNKEYEKKRKFCRHNINHFIDVARIAYIYNLENNLGFNKEIIYTAAMLHDIGKWKQYECNIPHNEASANIAMNILNKCKFHQNEISIIINAILTHRNFDGDSKSLNYILYFADKKSRICFKCKVIKKCSWNTNIKNSALTY